MKELQKEFFEQIEWRLVFLLEEILGRVPTDAEVKKQCLKVVQSDGRLTYYYMTVPLMHSWWWPSKDVAYKIELAKADEPLLPYLGM